MKHVHKSAFPIHVSDDGSHAEGFFDSGLSKREYFAAMAMQGIMANPACSPETMQQFMNIAEDAIRVADELLKQLEPKQ